MPFQAITRRHAARLLGLAGLALVAAAPARAGSLLDPQAFASLGVFEGAGAYFLDSTSLTLARFDGTGPVFQGIEHEGMAVFAFDQFTLDAGSWIVGEGTRAIAILSRSDMIVQGGISVGGDGLNGGPGGFATGQGPGYGGPTVGSGGGGGHGGAGGAGGAYINEVGGVGAVGGAGGQAYGDLSQWLVGGSGGTAGGTPFPHALGGAGDGGGAIELGALGTISVTGLISATGGNGYAYGGGGGAGGGVRMHASVIELSSTGVSIDVSGGNGADVTWVNSNGAFLRGGGGGGGRVYLQANEFLVSADSVRLAGGEGHQNGQDGQLVLAYATVPEPSSFLLAGLAAGPVLLARRLLRRS